MMKATISGVLAFALAGGVALGGDVACDKTVKELEKAIEEGGIYVETAKKGVVLSGYVDASYSYNANGGGTDSGINGTPGAIRTHMFDVDSNDFNVNQVKLALEKALPEENTWAAGFRVDLMFGEDVKVFADNDAGLGDDAVAVEQAYVQFRVPVGNGLDFKFGKFVSLLGYEVIETPANLNVSRGYLFTFAIPWLHTGFLMAYKFNDMVDVKLGLVNGWNNSDSNFLGIGDDAIGTNGSASDFAKAVTAQIALHAPGGNADVVNSFIYSFEGEGVPGLANVGAGDELGNVFGTENAGIFVWDVWAQWRPKAFNDKLLLAVNADIGKAYDNLMRDSFAEDTHNGLPDRFGRDENTDTWWGIALYAKYQVTDVFSLAVRGEYFHDGDGTARLADAMINSTADGDYDSIDENFIFVTGTDAWSLTTTLGFDLWENMLARLEYRMDVISSDGGAGVEEMDDADDLRDVNAFTNNQSTQHTFILDFSYSF